jgi:anion-transporting  ArsA/GET3 family ATPase
VFTNTRLILVSGKGGVGKTVVAAALGRTLADTGRRVLVLEADPRDNLHHLFGVEPSGGAIIEAGPHLAIQNASPRTILDEVVRDRLKISALSSRVLASPIYQHFADGAPGLKEMMLLGYAMLATEGRRPRADVVILDAPASGHGLSLLTAPQLVSDVITTGPLGTMARRIAAFVADPTRSAIVLATLAEESPVTETLETAAQVATRAGRAADLVVVNQVWPEQTAAADATDAQALWTARRRMNERELARLSKQWRGARVVLPLVGEDFGPALLTLLVEDLAGQLRPMGNGRWPMGTARPKTKKRA